MEHDPHHFHILFGVVPIALRIKIPEIDPFLKTILNPASFVVWLGRKISFCDTLSKTTERETWSSTPQPQTRRELPPLRPMAFSTLVSRKTFLSKKAQRAPQSKGRFFSWLTNTVPCIRKTWRASSGRKAPATAGETPPES